MTCCRQGFGQKLVTLMVIKEELINHYQDHRPKYESPSGVMLFNLLTKVRAPLLLPAPSS